MIKYDTPVDPAADTTSHGLMLRLVGADHDVLDVGCATGYLAKEMRAAGNRVSGVEQDPESAELARVHLDRLVVADLETADLVEEFGAGTFDVLVFGDVLEHLRNPHDVLRRARPLLRPGGYVVVSIPNVAHGSVRLALLTGDWTYRSLGLLDNTHVHMFTRAGVDRMLGSAGLVAVERLRTLAPPLGTEVSVNRAALPAGAVEYVEADPDSWTYQFVWRAVRDDADGILLARLAALEEEVHVASTAIAGYRETVAGEQAARAQAEAVAAQEQAARAGAEAAEQSHGAEAARLRGLLDDRERYVDALADQLDAVQGSRTMRVARRARSLLVVIGLRGRGTGG